MGKFLDLDGLTHFWEQVKSVLNTKATKTEVTQLANKVNNLIDSTSTVDEAFTKTIGGIVNLSNTVTLNIGFTPKYFEFSSIDSVGVYLRWNKTDGWTGTIGPLYNYEVDSGANTITISTHVSAGKFIWRAFG